MKLTDIIRVTSRVTGITVAQIESRSQRRDWTTARRIAWVVAHDRFGVSQSEIGRQSGRNHTSVGHAYRALLARAKADPIIRDMLDEVARALTDIDYVPRRIPIDPSKRQQIEAQRPARPKPVSTALPVVEGEICTPEWWASNDARFRAGMAHAAHDAERAKRSEKLQAFLHMGKSARNLTVVDAGGKSPLALPRSLCIGLLQSPSPDPLLIQGH